MVALLEWDQEADVVVVGYGLAGGVAAICARDGGAEVLIVEKSKHPGGCSILSGGSALIAHDVEKATQYFTALSGGRVSAPVIRAFAQSLGQNLEFITSLAKADGADLRAEVRDGRYPLPGSEESFGSVVVTRVPGFTGFPGVTSTRANGQTMFRMIMDNVGARNIPTLLSTAARELVTDARGGVVGIIAESQGKERAIKARRAVILACGGFEQNPWMRWQYLQGNPFFSMAPLSNTGDGVTMAQKVGAALWHMWHVHGSYGFKFPGYPIAFRHPFGGPRNPDRKMPWIVMDKFGKRYMNEYPPAPQDTAHRPMEVFDPDLIDYPRIPSYVVFDEEGRRLGPIAFPMGFVEEYRYDWSRDNLKEVEQGWIMKANSLAELAAKIKEREDNKGFMVAATLERTVSEWNECVKGKKDPLFRPPGTMMAINAPPFYAAPVWPVITNTQGGPMHNERQQVLDAFGKPIARLYAAGELGSFFAHLYELGGNLGECFSSGRIAGRNAALEKVG